MKQRIFTQSLLAAFACHLKSEERSTATVEKYERDIVAFSSWLHGRSVTKELISAWKDDLLSRGLAPATVNAKLCAVNGLLRFLGWGDCRVKLLKLQRRVFRDTAKELTRAEYDRLVETAQALGRERLALLMETMGGTGVRVSEVRFITVEAARSGQAVVNLKGKVRVVLMPGKLCRKLLKYAKKQMIASGEIFLTKDGQSLSRKLIWREMKTICKKAGVAPSKVFPHNLRHLFATVFYRACRDIVKLSDVLGHSSIETTRIYLMTTGAEHARYINRLGLVC